MTFGKGQDESVREATQFKEGNPGKPKGSKNFKTLLRRLMETDMTAEDLEGKNIKMSVRNAATIALAAKGIKEKDVAALKMLLEWTEDEQPEAPGQKVVHQLSDSDREIMKRYVQRAEDDSK